MAMVQPDSVYGCDRCEFRNVCLKEMHEYRDGGGHLTLLATVTPSKLENFPDDIESIADLVEATGLDGFAATSQIRGRVWQTKKPELLNPSEPLNIPEFDIEIDIDLENSQAALGEQIQDSTIGQDLVYLYGFGIHDRTLSKDWRSATIESVVNFDNTSEAEYEILSRTWHLLTSQIELALEQGKTLGIFHYSHYEKIWWRRYVSRHEGKPGVPSLEEVERIMATYFVDLQPLATRVSFPTMNYSVKSLAKVAGFTWSADDAGGAMSLLKYKLATSSEVAIEEQEAAKQWLIEYNLDDVRATFAVRDYLRSLEL
jgi:predicted RecB family nuclease